MKIVHGERTHSLTWKDGSFLGGVILAVGGLAGSFGWGVVVAAVGVGLMAVPFVRVGDTG